MIECLNVWYHGSSCFYDKSDEVSRYFQTGLGLLTATNLYYGTPQSADSGRIEAGTPGSDREMPVLRHVLQAGTHRACLREGQALPGMRVHLDKPRQEIPPQMSVLQIHGVERQDEETGRMRQMRPPLGAPQQRSSFDMPQM